jgi:hypothetical protein
MKANGTIYVTSHISRDFLQNSVYFNTLSKVVWEYISNSLDNSKEGVPLGIDVEISNKRISITDNGEGMSRVDLSNFFTMHGINIQRKRGKRVRGRFGTGKSAAFGIANYIKIDTVKDGLRNIVELRRSDIEAAQEGDPIPVKDNLVNEVTNLDDGTTVEVKELNIKVLDQLQNTISYIERHLARYKRATVTINGHICAFKEPPSTSEKKVIPPKRVIDLLGDIELILKISPTPLDKDTRGIDILAHGIWHETTLAGLENKEFANYLFGEIDVPIFEEKEDWKIPPFDNTRNNTLNRQNPYVVTLLGWMKDELEKERRELVEQDRKRKLSEEAKKLKKEAEKLAKILNDDFEKLLEDYELAKQLTAKRGKTRISPDPSTLVSLLPGDGDEETGLQQAGQPHGKGKRGDSPPGPGDEPRKGPSLIDGEEKGSLKPASSKGSRRKKGIFSIEYLHETPNALRSRYEPETRTIVINLDHPQIASMYESNNRNVEARNFREITYEVAIVEYALAIPYERIKIDEYYDAADALLDTRETINRLSKRIPEVVG